MKKFSERNLERNLKHLDLINQSLNAMTELISNWSQLNDNQKLELLKQRRDEIRKGLNKESEKKL